MVFDVKQRRRSKRVVAHVWSERVPSGSFYQLDSAVLVASPAFMFLVAATLLDKHALIAFGCELCGYYGFDESARRGFRKRTVPLVTVEQLRDYLEGAVGLRGYRAASVALPFIVPFSASPMETLDVMALCLP